MEISLVDSRDVSTKGSKKGFKKAYIDRGRLYTEEELRKYAQGVIDERIRFCRDVKKAENVNKCACEAIGRWIRLFTNYQMEGSVALGNLRVAAVKELFEEMKKEGKFDQEIEKNR